MALATGALHYLPIAIPTHTPGGRTLPLLRLHSHGGVSPLKRCPKISCGKALRLITNTRTKCLVWQKE